VYISRHLFFAHELDTKNLTAEEARLIGSHHTYHIYGRYFSFLPHLVYPGLDHGLISSWIYGTIFRLFSVPKYSFWCMYSPRCYCQDIIQPWAAVSIGVEIRQKRALALDLVATSAASCDQTKNIAQRARATTYNPGYTCIHHASSTG
jgi:hypothetical protein